MAVTASFSSGLGVVTALGDALDNNVTASRNGAGTILVNGGAVPISGGTPTVANTSLIEIFGQGGNDTLALDETNGALPAAHLFGGIGNDVMTGGSGGDQLTGGAGDDQMFGGAGNDRMIWNPGDGTDLMEGGDGTDTAEVNGDNAGEVFTATANGTRVRFDRVSPAPFSIDIGTSESLVVNMNGGDDSFSAAGNLAALIGIIVDGGAGNDTILGGNGADLLLGGDGNDFIDGNQGNDTALLGTGDDVFQWDPGDGSDTIEGQAGTDTLLFNGNGANEIFDVSANGGRVRFLRNVGNIVMDLNDVEHVAIHALGGVDSITVNDLTGTDVKEVTVDLAAVGGSDDGQTDTVIVNGTVGDDTINVSSSAGVVTVAGLSASILVTHGAATDVLDIRTLAGADVIDASALGAGISLRIDSGDNDDTVIGGAGADIIMGAAGNDMMDGGAGADLLNGSIGNDLYVVDNAGDVVDETAASGIDTVRSSISFSIVNSGTVFGQLENLILAGSANINGTGNAFANVIVGNAGANVLTGGADFDTLIGDLGNDTYVLEDGADIVVDSGGVDTITSTVSRSLVGYAAIERLLLTGASPINGTGNNLTNVLVGNGAANVLSGDGGNDVLVGLGGLDTLLGGAGNDTYNLENETDIVSDSSGFDAILSTITRTLASFPTIERLVLGGTLAINGTGNNLANALVGNAAANILAGGNGNDALNGGDGNDVLNGGRGLDLMFGGNGNDRFVFNTSLSANKDTLLDFNKFGNDTFVLDDAIFSKLSLGQLKAANFHVGTSAADANDFIVYNQATGVLVYDVNGSAAGGAFQFASLTNRPTLTIADFIVA